MRGVGVVGLGIGRAHVWSLRGLRDRFKVVAVCDNGSEFEALVAPEQDAASLPTPAGSPRA